MSNSSRKRNAVKRPDKSVIIRSLRYAPFTAAILACLCRLFSSESLTLGVVIFEQRIFYRYLMNRL